MRLAADGVRIGTRGQGITQVIVPVGRLRATGGDLVNVDVHGGIGRGNQFEPCFFPRFAKRYDKAIRHPIAVTPRLQPAPSFL